MKQDVKKEKSKNYFWGVYDKKMKIVSISKDKRFAKEEALKLSNYRWTFQTFKKDWKYLEKDGYRILKSRIIPCCNCDRLNGECCSFCY